MPISWRDAWEENVPGWLPEAYQSGFVFAALVALVLYNSAVIAEIMRAGILSLAARAGRGGAGARAELPPVDALRDPAAGPPPDGAGDRLAADHAQQGHDARLDHRDHGGDAARADRHSSNFFAAVRRRCCTCSCSSGCCSLPSTTGCRGSRGGSRRASRSRRAADGAGHGHGGPAAGDRGALGPAAACRSGGPGRSGSVVVDLVDDAVVERHDVEVPVGAGVNVGADADFAGRTAGSRSRSAPTCAGCRRHLSASRGSSVSTARRLSVSSIRNRWPPSRKSRAPATNRSPRYSRAELPAVEEADASGRHLELPAELGIAGRRAPGSVNSRDNACAGVSARLVGGQRSCWSPK